MFENLAPQTDIGQWLAAQIAAQKEEEDRKKKEQAAQIIANAANARDTQQLNQALAAERIKAAAKAPQVDQNIIDRGLDPRTTVQGDAPLLLEQNSSLRQSQKDRETRNQLIEILKRELITPEGSLVNPQTLIDQNKKRYYGGNKVLGILKRIYTGGGALGWEAADKNIENQYNAKLILLKSLLESGDKNAAAQVNAETRGQEAANKAIGGVLGQAAKTTSDIQKGGQVQQKLDTEDFLVKQKASQIAAQTKLLESQLPLIAAKIGLTQAQTKQILAKAEQAGLGNQFEVANKMLLMPPDRAQQMIKNLKSISDATTKPENLSMVKGPQTYTHDEQGNIVPNAPSITWYNRRTGQPASIGGGQSIPPHPSTGTIGTGKPSRVELPSQHLDPSDRADVLFKSISAEPDPNKAGIPGQPLQILKDQDKVVKEWESIKLRNDSSTGNILNAWMKGELNKWQGPMGVIGEPIRRMITGKSNEEINREMNGQMTEYQHIKRLASGRPAQQLVESFDKVLSPKSETAESAARRAIGQSLLVQASLASESDSRVRDLLSTLDRANKSYPTKGGTLAEAVNDEITRVMKEMQQKKVVVMPDFMRVLASMNERTKTEKLRKKYNVKGAKTPLEQFMEDNKLNAQD